MVAAFRINKKGRRFHSFIQAASEYILARRTAAPQHRYTLLPDPPSLSPNLSRYYPTSFSLLFSSSFHFYFFEFRLEKNLFGSFVLMDLLLFFFFFGFRILIDRGVLLSMDLYISGCITVFCWSWSCNFWFF